MNSLPSLLVFGPHTELPSEQALEDFRRDLISAPELSCLNQAVEDLPRFWRALVKYDNSLSNIPGEKHFECLAQWMRNGGYFPCHESKLPNHYALLLTVLL